MSQWKAENYLFEVGGDRANWPLPPAIVHALILFENFFLLLEKKSMKN